MGKAPTAVGNLLVRVATNDVFDVRWFRVREGVGSLFEVELSALCTSSDVAFDAIVGRAAAFQVIGVQGRGWTGVVASLELERAESGGLSRYRLRLAPAAWLLTQRTSYRVFQDMSEPEIALAVFRDWGLELDVRLDLADFPKREYRVQFGETDYAFAARMLEEAGVSFYFETVLGEATHLVLDQAPHARAAIGPLPYFDQTDGAPVTGWVTALSIARNVRPGRHTIKDYDQRLDPTLSLMASSRPGLNEIEDRLETYQYGSGAFLYRVEGPSETPVADDRLRARTHMPEASRLVQRRLDAGRSDALRFEFTSSVLELAPGVVALVDGHPSSLLDGAALLVVATVLQGEVNGEWSHRCIAQLAALPFRPALTTPRPTVKGVENATVVGPAGEEIHTDELGRVRVQFHWDRYGNMDEQSSCWMHVSHPWAGAGYGAINLPRVGQEVLVEFLGGDPDRPIVVGRVYTTQQAVPYGLPANKTQSGWKSSSTHGTGGYNELMFEDNAGAELVRMRAERDLDAHVLHDERRRVDRDRTTKILRNEETLIKNDERHQVERDRSTKVLRHEELYVGGNRQAAVDGNSNETIAKNASSQVNGRRSEVTAKSRSVMIGQSSSTVVGMSESTNVGVMRSTKVGLMDSLSVLGMRNVSVGLEQTFSVGAPGWLTSLTGGKLPNTTIKMTPMSIKLSTSKGASITLEGDTITLDAKEIRLGSSDKIKLDAPLIVLNGPGLPTARLCDTAPDIVTNAATSVQIGGPVLPFPITETGFNAAGERVLHFGDKFHVVGKPEFVSAVLAHMGRVGATKDGAALFASIAESKHSIIVKFGENSGQRPPGNLEGMDKINYTMNSHSKGAAVYTADYPPRLVTLKIGADGTNSEDYMMYPPEDVASGLPAKDGYAAVQGTGKGADSWVLYNPAEGGGPPGNPAERTLFHELTHADHTASGSVDRTPMGGGWDNSEEFNTIQAENGYLDKLGYPYKRVDHHDTWMDSEGKLWAPDPTEAEGAGQ